MAIIGKNSVRSHIVLSSVCAGIMAAMLAGCAPGILEERAATSGTEIAPDNAPILEPRDGYDILHHALELRPAMDGSRIAGVQTIRLRITREDQTALSFSGDRFAIESATIDGSDVAARQDGNTAFTLPPTLSAVGTELALTVRYTAHPERGYSAANGMVWTEYFACDWMVCAQNAFADKATIDLDLIVPAGLSTLGPGELQAVVPSENGLALYRWREPIPHAAYLYTFAVGAFVRAEESAGPSRLLYIGNRGETDETELHALLGTTPQMLAFFEERAGVPLPRGRYTQLLVPGGAAQEAASYSIIGRAMIGPIVETPDEDWVIAHELAHQWWGNSVSAADLSDSGSMRASRFSWSPPGRSIAGAARPMTARWIWRAKAGTGRSKQDWIAR